MLHTEITKTSPWGSTTFWRRRFGAGDLALAFWRWRFGAESFWRRDCLAQRLFGAGYFGA